MVAVRSWGVVGPEDGSDASQASVLSATESGVGPSSMMIVGDSLTHGAAGDHTWRYFLYERLASRYGREDLFVGPRQAPNGGDVEDYAVPIGWDKDHASLGGRKLDCYLNGTANNPLCRDPDSARADLESFDPDLVIVLLGANGVLLPWGESTPEEFVADMEQYVALGRELNPAVDFLVLGALPAGAPDSESSVLAAELRAGVSELAARLDLAASRVVYVDTSRGFDPALHTSDGIHPNSAGDEVIAGNVANALAQNFGIG